LQKEKQIRSLRQQERQQKALKSGIDKLTNDKFYRDMYDDYKETQGCYRGSRGIIDMYSDIEQPPKNLNKKQPYQNELARILNEDC
tara:strand:+ start:318 stop:575 length:258 start_codon:yes stop_codon:yes gene_type:complete